MIRRTGRLATSWRIVGILLVLAPIPNAMASEWVVAPGGTGAGSRRVPFARIQDALGAASPGDVITIQPGTYRESLLSVRDGLPDAPITLRASVPGSVVVTASGRVLTVRHASLVVDGLVLDGQYGADDLVRVSDAGHGLHLRNLELRHSSRDLIDMGSPRDVVVENCLLHHALNAEDGRTDAHGIVAGAVRGLVVRDTEIHTFSGDGIQLDPARAVPGWDDVTIERARIWLAPLPAPENGFAAGVVPGENAVDTKANATADRSRIVIRDTTAWGFRDGITNMAAFNLKENIDATLDGITVFDSDIAFRLRGATTGGAWVSVTNAVVHDVARAFRYEDNIKNLRIWNSTLGRGVTRAFEAASSAPDGLDVRNLLILGTRPAEATHASNMAVDSRTFINAEGHDYRLAPGSAPIDAGVPIPGVATDRVGNARPQGRGPDVGAYESLREARDPAE